MSNKPFSGKTLHANLNNRGGSEGDEKIQSEAFLEMYNEFREILMSLDEEDRKEFLGRANLLVDDKDVGKTLENEDASVVKEEFSGLEMEDLKAIMDFLVEEEVISFDEK